MLAKSQRLPRLLFSAVFGQGKRVQGANTTLIIAPALNFACSVVVSKKVAKKAHDRNRIRRRLYASVRELIATNPPALSLIIMTKPQISSLTRVQFKEVLQVEIGRALNNR